MSSEKKVTCTLGWLSNVKNSCYIDSVLYGIFHFNNDFIEKYFLNADVRKIRYTSGGNSPKMVSLETNVELRTIVEKIQRSLQEINRKIKEGGADTCTLLRSQIASYIDLRNKSDVKLPQMALNWTDSQLDTKDVYRLFEDMFNLPALCVRSRVTLNSNPMTLKGDGCHFNISNVYTDNFSIIYDNLLVGIEDGKSVEDYLIRMTTNDPTPSDYIKSSDNRHAYQNSYIDYNIISTPILIVPVNRIVNLGQGPVKVMTSVLPSPQLKLLDGSQLVLQSIMVHLGSAYGGHYISYINCGGFWYLFDDMRKKLEEIGTNLESHYDQICRNATDYIYAPI